MARQSPFRLFFYVLIACPLVAQTVTQTSPGTNTIAPGYDALAQACGLHLDDVGIGHTLLGLGRKHRDEGNDEKGKE